jgi:hypothetical protein
MRPPSLGGRKFYEDLKSDMIIFYGETTLRNVCRRCGVQTRCWAETSKLATNRAVAIQSADK